MKLKSLALLAFFAANAHAVPVLLNESDAKVYNCLERLTSLGSTGIPAALSQFNYNVQVVDYGTSFFVISTSSDSLAFSGMLRPDIAAGYKTNQPVKGVTMGKGYGEEAGTYIYIGEHTLISWNCRK